MTTALTIIDRVLQHPNLVCLNIRLSEDKTKAVACTLIVKGNGEWCRGEGATADAALIDLGRNLNQHGLVVYQEPVVTHATLPGLTTRMPGA